MSETLTRQEFATALANAVTGVLTVYREVDAMMRELSAGLGEAEPRFAPLIRRMVPGGGNKNPDGRYLRNYQAAIFVPADSIEDDDDDDEDEEEAGEDDSDGDEESPKKVRRHLEIKSGSSLIVARAAIYDRSRISFEPSLTIGVLARCRPEVDVPAGTILRTKNGRFKRLFRAIDAQRVPGKTLKTTVTATAIGLPKAKATKLVFDEPAPLRTYPLFEITSLKLQEVVANVRADWSVANP